MTAQRRTIVALAADLALVLIFVLIGRASHDEDPISGTLITLWPFAVGVVLGWLIARGWRAPVSVWPTGVTVWVAAVVAGMLLRAVSGQGVQIGFVIVTTVVLGVFLIGWRAIAALVGRRRSGRVSVSRRAG